MTEGHGAGPTTIRLAHELAGGAAFEPELLGWLVTAPRFRAFADANRDKIRKKVRGATDVEALGDVLAELHVARLLLADKAVSLAFEPFGSGKVGPDFAVTVGGSGSMLEVTRRHGPTPDPTALAHVVLAKLRQLPPSVPNVLLVAIDAESAAVVEVSAAIRLLRARADAKDEAFFADRGFATARAFYDRFLRLGGIVAWSERDSAMPRAMLWTNASARIALPSKLGRAILVALNAPG